MTTQMGAKALTPETYLALERASEQKHEYRNGEMLPMTGASRWHNLIVGKVTIRSIDCTVELADLYEKVPALRAAEVETNGTH
jgi:Uma2 family endonuclease